ncbi:MAG: hypothetical protein J7639_28095 [Paenibacillaceae bacterium]|nr:hypothetical protein [Paenibacillaceae bacterium]
MKKVSLAVMALLLVIVAVLAACSKEKQDAQSSASPAPSASGASPAPAADIAFPLAAPITLNIFASKNAAVKKDFKEMLAFKNLQQKTNVTVNWRLATAGDESNQKQSLLIASNDLPDAFYGAWVFSEAEIIKYGTEGILIPLEDLIKKHAPNLQKVFQQRPELEKKLRAPDGHIYTLPMVQEDPHANMPNTMLINKKWLDNLNLKMPTTIEEFREVLLAFKNGDPNKNGKKDEIPFSFIGKGHHILGFSGFTGVFGKVVAGPLKNLSVTNGKVEYAPVTEEFKQFLTYMNGLYKDGLIDPEAFTHDNNVYYAKFRNKERIVGAGFAWSPFGINQVPDADGDYVTLPPMKGPGGKDPLWYMWEPTHSLGAFAITKVNKYPEITMKWIDQMYDPLTSYEMAFGPKDVTFKQTAGGKYESIPVPSGMTANDFLYGEAPGANFVGAVLKEFRSQFAVDAATQSKIDAVKITLPYAPKEIYPALIMSGEDSNKLTDFNMAVETNQISWIAKFIMNGNIDKEWNDYVKTFQQAGMDQAVALYQKYYDSYKK